MSQPQKAGGFPFVIVYSSGGSHRSPAGFKVLDEHVGLKNIVEASFGKYSLPQIL